MFTGRKGEEEKDDKDVEAEHPLPALLGEELHVHEGHDEIDHHPQGDGRQLDGDEAGAGDPHEAGGAVNEGHPEEGGGQDEGEEDQVRLAEKFFDPVGEPHGL